MMKKGLITVECALVLPVFLIFCMQLFSLFEILSVYCRMECALEEVAEETAILMYDPANKEEGISSFPVTDLFIREEVIRKIKESKPEMSVIENGAAGLSFSGSDYGQDGEVNLTLSYRVVPWFSFMNIGRTELTNHCRMHVFCGYHKSETDEDIGQKQAVYVTKTGTAYHLFPDCSYLKADIHFVDKREIPDLRNVSGKKYTACEMCKRGFTGAEKDKVIITTYGTKYHSNYSCGALFKDASSIPLSEVGSRHLCNKCEKRRNGK